jgi:hypothetical protein
MRELDPSRTPATIIGAVAAGTVVVPFLIVYSFLFIARGLFIQVEQPDITSSRTGEAIAGFVALLFLILVFIGMGRLLNGRDRWIFIAGQLIALGVAVALLVTPSSGQPQVPAVVLIGALTAVVCACLPTSWAWIETTGGTQPPARDELARAEIVRDNSDVRDDPTGPDQPDQSVDELFRGHQV